MDRETLPTADIFVIWFQAAVLIFAGTQLIHHYHFIGLSVIVGYALIAAYAVGITLVSLKLWAQFRDLRVSKNRDDTLAFNKESSKFMRINGLIFAFYFLGVLVLYVRHP